MKKLFLALVMMGGAMAANAQFGYVFKKATGTYTPLINDTDVHDGDLWLADNISIPAGFSYTLGGTTLSRVNMIANSIGPATDTSATGVISTFIGTGGLILADRGLLDPSGVAMSPVTYKTEGSTPNRVFKLQYSNAGNVQEAFSAGTMADSLNLQVWIYETTNVIEYHYGTSGIANPEDYFDTTGVQIGFIKNLDGSTETFDYAYFLKGSASAPTVDSTNDPDMEGIKFLGTYPANGTIYRFIPYAAATGFGDPGVAAQFNVFPTTTSSTLYISNKQTAAAHYEVVSVSGQQMNLRGDLASGNNSINVDLLPSGMYMLQVSSDNGAAVYKFVKQ